MRVNAYMQLLEISEDLRSLIYDRVIVQERFTFNGLERRKIGEKTATIKDMEFTQVSHDWMKDLSGPAKVFAITNILEGLRKYNLLWYWPTPTKRTEKMIIKELVDNKVLFRTETVEIYLVNPLKMWRGQILTCVEATKQLLREHKHPSKELVRDLRPGDKYTLRSAEDFFNASDLAQARYDSQSSEEEFKKAMNLADQWTKDNTNE